MKYLCISIRWLDDRYHGQDADGEAEWPPSPLRLFQALLATAARRFGETGSFLPALAWLQEKDRPTPIIVAPRAQPGRPFVRFLPNNDSDKRLDRQDRLASKGVRPTFFLQQTPIHYLWQVSDQLTSDADEHIRHLCELAKGVIAFGWGVDMASGDGLILSDEKAQRLQGEWWFATSYVSGKRWRVPAPATLDALADRHGRFLSRLNGGILMNLSPLDESAYSVVTYRRASDPIQRPFSAFRLLDPETGKPRTFPATRSVTVAGMIRGAAHQAATQADRDVQWVGAFVCGHHDGPDSFPRFSYLVLPSIQPVIGVGRINRVLIAEPLGSDGKETAWIRRLLAGRLAQNEQSQHALLVPLPRDDNVLRDYVRTSQTWTSVTPVALPGSDDGMAGKTAKLLDKMFRHAGYSSDAVEDLEYHRVPFLRGAEDAKRYRPGGDHHLSNCTMYHMRIRWKWPMPGPMALGAGRHCGLGVFAALS